MNQWRAVIWSQFGAAIETLDNLLLACPDELWRSRLWRGGPQEGELSEFWYVGYHALFWLDLYLYGSEEGFAPPGEVTFLELLLYNMRHVQDHAAQLSLFLGQKGLSVPDYVTKATLG